MTILIGTPHTHNAGYFINDKDLATRQEADIQTCTHCQCVIKMQEWKNDGAFCRKCMAPICGLCGDRMLTHGCEPFLQRLEQFASAMIKFEQYLKVAGLEPVAPPPSIIVTG
jgi:hypothetical protein